MGFMAAVIFVHGPPNEVARCHCMAQVPVPPFNEADNIAVPPTQTSLSLGVMLILGPGVTTTVAVLEVAASQPPPVHVYVAR